MRIGRHKVTHETVQTRGCEHGRDREQHREACCDERAEGDDQNGDRQRQRREFGPAHVGGEPEIDFVLG
jgi:hypothetical protein